MLSLSKYILLGMAIGGAIVAFAGAIVNAC